jgi:hypothetical protein
MLDLGKSLNEMVVAIGRDRLMHLFIHSPMSRQFSVVIDAFKRPFRSPSSWLTLSPVSVLFLCHCACVVFPTTTKQKNDTFFSILNCNETKRHLTTNENETNSLHLHGRHPLVERKARCLWKGNGWFEHC